MRSPSSATAISSTAGSVSGPGNTAVLARDEIGEPAHGCDRHEQGQEVPTRLEVGQRIAIERAQALLVDDVEADKRMARAIIERDVEREGFEQIVPLERCEEGRRGAEGGIEVAKVLDRKSVV